MNDIRDIIAYTNMHEDSCVNIGIFFGNATEYRLVSINMKVICSNGQIYNLFNNKMLYISSNSSLWADSIRYNFSAKPLKAIIEIHSSGKLLYIKSFPLTKEWLNDKIYILNADICWRRENPHVISVFNTNGNLLFLKGIYKDLWELLMTPAKCENVINAMIMKGYDESKIKFSINSLIMKGLVFEEFESKIEYI